MSKQMASFLFDAHPIGMGSHLVPEHRVPETPTMTPLPEGGNSKFRIMCSSTVPTSSRQPFNDADFHTGASRQRVYSAFLPSLRVQDTGQGVVASTNEEIAITFSPANKAAGGEGGDGPVQVEPCVCVGATRFAVPHRTHAATTHRSEKGSGENSLRTARALCVCVWKPMSGAA